MSSIKDRNYASFPKKEGLLLEKKRRNCDFLTLLHPYTYRGKI